MVVLGCLEATGFSLLQKVGTGPDTIFDAPGYSGNPYLKAGKDLEKKGYDVTKIIPACQNNVYLAQFQILAPSGRELLALTTEIKETIRRHFAGIRSEDIIILETTFADGRYSMRVVLVPKQINVVPMDNNRNGIKAGPGIDANFKDFSWLNDRLLALGAEIEESGNLDILSIAFPNQTDPRYILTVKIGGNISRDAAANKLKKIIARSLMLKPEEIKISFGYAGQDDASPIVVASFKTADLFIHIRGRMLPLELRMGLNVKKAAGI